MKKTKLICTIGPASMDKKTLRQMYKFGMNAARINTAHGDFRQYRKMVDNVRSIGQIPIILDIKGPEIRFYMDKNLDNYNNFLIKKGLEFVISDNKFKTKGNFHFNYNVSSKLRIGDKVLFNDGNLRTKVIKKKKGSIIVKALNHFLLRDGVGVNIINRSLNLPSLSNKDLKAISFAKKNKIEFIALSFTRDKNDIIGLRKKLGKSGIDIIAKIENFEGVKNIDDIIRYADGIMVARGDLGIEVPSEKVPIIQKDILDKSNISGKLDIVATQMLESMVSSPHPTRAETSDVANAILDGADCVMLSEETAIGSYPVEAVHHISKIAKEVEPRIVEDFEFNNCTDLSNSIAKAVEQMCRCLHIDKIVTLTESSYTARMIARFRPKIPVIAVTDDQMVRNQMEVYYGIVPVFMKKTPKVALLLHTAKHCHKLGLLKKDDKVIFAAKIFTEKQQVSNLLQVNTMDELLSCAKKM